MMPGFIVNPVTSNISYHPPNYIKHFITFLNMECLIPQNVTQIVLNKVFLNGFADTLKIWKHVTFWFDIMTQCDEKAMKEKWLDLLYFSAYMDHAIICWMLRQTNNIVTEIGLFYLHFTLFLCCALVLLYYNACPNLEWDH